MTRIEVHVDRLVLDAGSPNDGRALATAVARALSQALAVHGVGDAILAGPAIDRVDAGGLTLAPSAPPATAGHQIGHAVAAALAPPRGKP